jgi:hypothetical protein
MGAARDPARPPNDGHCGGTVAFQTHKALVTTPWRICKSLTRIERWLR